MFSQFLKWVGTALVSQNRGDCSASPYKTDPCEHCFSIHLREEEMNETSYEDGGTVRRKHRKEIHRSNTGGSIPGRSHLLGTKHS